MSADPGTLPMFRRAASFGARTAVREAAGDMHYDQLLSDSARIAAGLLRGGADLEGSRIAFAVTPGADYVRVLAATWRAGGVAVPLCASHPPPELAYVIDDCQCDTIVTDAAFADTLRPLAVGRGVRLTTVGALLAQPAAPLPTVDAERAALIVYTSGTTSRPKGVVLRHRHLQAQIETLVTAWQWSSDDDILHVLPLHHVHGIVNALLCALWSGATCTMLPRFDPTAAWHHLSGGEISLFMAVPTIYQRLVRAAEEAPPARRQQWRAGARRLRLMVSGSAALPVPLFERWRELTGHSLLERYGMTEIGMALSNPFDGERVPGSVGTPLPGVDVRLTGENEIEVRGPGVFDGYWRRPRETAAAFDGDWFRTGDQAVVEDGRYRILGRSSVDILKTGGYKVSALEVEHVLRGHPAIGDCAVVGISDDEWGQRVAAAVVLRSPATATELREWALERLAHYKTPSRWLVVDSLPRNPIGKVLKPRVAALFESSSDRDR